MNLRIEFGVKLAGPESWEERLERAEGEVDGIREMKKDVWKRVWDVLEQERKRIIGHEAEDEREAKTAAVEEVRECSSEDKEKAVTSRLRKETVLCMR